MAAVPTLSFIYRCRMGTFGTRYTTMKYYICLMCGNFLCLLCSSCSSSRYPICKKLNEIPGSPIDMMLASCPKICLPSPSVVLNRKPPCLSVSGTSQTGINSTNLVSQPTLQKLSGEQSGRDRFPGLGTLKVGGMTLRKPLN